MGFFNKKQAKAKLAATEKETIGNNMNFAAAESYKTLRTNLTYSFPDVSGCKIIGVTSSTQSEGKSLTAINLSYFLSESDKRVLLIEGDMRVGTITAKLKLKNGLGLSNLLIDPTLDRNTVPVKYERLFVITAGDIPPNPSELLESRAMKELIAYYSRYFDYIIVDLPPVLIVPDALVISKLLHGMIVVVRHSVTMRAQLTDTIRQLKMVGSRIIGFVYNGASEEHGAYNGSYNSYYNNYYSNYYKSAIRSAREAKKKDSAE